MVDRPSYEKINYNLRPAKNIERKMIAEACRLLPSARPVNRYRYVGFGSPFFSDFRLFHKTLGFQRMINIEVEGADQERFEFNKPFACIQMMYGDSSEVFPDLAWRDELTVVWLDYDRRLNGHMIEDIEFLAASLQPWSLLIVTVRAKAADYGSEEKKIPTMETDLERSLDGTVTQGDLAQDRIAETIRSICDGSIRDTLLDRNGMLAWEEQLEYRQIMNFAYDDGTPMITFGGLFVPKSDEAAFSDCGFSSLEFYCPGTEKYEIRAPLLTFKEQRALDSSLPNDTPIVPGLDQEDIDSYARVYRYFPAFTEAEL
jgi:hypothetical protein